MLNKKISYLVKTLIFIPLLGFSVLHAANKKKQVEPIELLIDFKISGKATSATPSGIPIFTVSGPGYAPKKIFRSGEISDKIKKHRKVTTLQGAQITFSGTPADPIVNFTCLPGSCTMAFAGGSVLTSDAGVPLTGRAINFWGPVINSPDFDPEQGIIPIRILGCGGLKEIAGKGKYAGMVGSICFNGVLNFDQANPSVLTGSSKCTITLHTPADPSSIP
ncbi:hypothetical protein MNBD_GAMMA12-1080 [hydrothermal vent metagenome]|uniref:Uncharacterized protein n=1 Tax=hydrothermal vent metagenome TaxID=652676 RepID=A0A3B0YRE6_9ZZZZ